MLPFHAQIASLDASLGGPDHPWSRLAEPERVAIEAIILGKLAWTKTEELLAGGIASSTLDGLVRGGWLDVWTSPFDGRPWAHTMTPWGASQLHLAIREHRIARTPAERKARRRRRRKATGDRKRRRDKRPPEVPIESHEWPQWGLAGTEPPFVIQMRYPRTVPLVFVEFVASREPAIEIVDEIAGTELRLFAGEEPERSHDGLRGGLGQKPSKAGMGIKPERDGRL